MVINCADISYSSFLFAIFRLPGIKSLAWNQTSEISSPTFLVFHWQMDFRLSQFSVHKNTHEKRSKLVREVPFLKYAPVSLG